MFAPLGARAAAPRRTIVRISHPVREGTTMDVTEQGTATAEHRDERSVSVSNPRRVRL